MQPAFYLVTTNIRKAPSTSHQKAVCSAMTVSVMGAELADRFPMLALNFAWVIIL
jgi:hypothetical protein